MKIDSAKILVYITFFISASVVAWFYNDISIDLQKTIRQGDDEMAVLTMMDHLDKLNTSITYLERNEKPFILSKNPLKSLEIEKGYVQARNEMDSLKHDCDNKYFQCLDILKLDSFITEKISLSKNIIKYSVKGYPDSARNLLEGSKDSLIVSGFIDQYNIVYNQGKKFIIEYQNQHSIETSDNFKKSKVITFILIVSLTVICWKLISQINLKNKVVAENRTFANIINNSSECIITTNTDHELTFCNNATKKMFQNRIENYIGKPPYEIFQSEESPEILKERRHYLNLNGSWFGEMSGIDSEGNRIEFQTTIKAIFDKKKKVIGYFAVNTDITQLKNAKFEITQLANSLKSNNESLELKVKEQTDLIKEIFERIEDAFIGVDEKLNIIYINKNTEDLLKVGDIKFEKSNVLSRLSEISNLNIYSLIENSFNNQNSVSAEFVIYDNGIHFKKIDIFHSLNGTSILIKDITKQKLIEEEIRKSARFYKLISSANETIIHAKNETEIFEKICSLSVDHEDIIFSWVGVPKKGFDSIDPIISFGKEEGYLDIVSKISINNIPSGNGPSGKAFREGKSYYSNDIANDSNMKLWREEALKRGYRSSISLPILLNNKPYALIALYASKPFYFTKEEIKIIEQVAENISFAIQNIYNAEQRKITEQQLNKLSHAINQSSVSVMISDLNGIIEYVNPAFEKLTGYNSTEVIGKTSSFLHSGYTPRETYEHLWESLLHKKEWKGEFCNKKKNGEIYWEDAIMSCFSDSDGVVKNYVAVKVDITERKEMEQSQTRMTMDLFQRNVNLEEFSYILSHNIRGPLSNILGLTDALKLDLKNEDRKVVEESIGVAAHSMDLVIKDVNKILQIRQSQVEKLESVRFDKIVSEIQDDLHFLIKNKNANIVTNFSAIDSCFSIRNYIRSIFFNLITNSLKFSKAEQPLKIEIRSEVLKDTIILYFKDNGIGIDLERHADKIFGLYKRFDLSIEGRGIGLFLIKSQIEHLNGKISVKSELGAWTEFKVELPI